jgi:hypothetical protein
VLQLSLPLQAEHDWVVQALVDPRGRSNAIELSIVLDFGIFIYNRQLLASVALLTPQKKPNLPPAPCSLLS